MRTLIFVSFLCTALAACRGAGPGADGSGAPAAAEGSAAAAAPAPPPGPGGDPVEDADTGATPAETRYAAPPADPTEPPPDLVTLMRAIGFADAMPADLADFVHVPPGAEGEAGSFGGSEGEVRVALVRYPNPRYARPHRTDVEERRRVVPDLGEAVAQQGRFVVHVRAAQRSRADQVVAAIVEELGWDEVSAPR